MYVADIGDGVSGEAPKVVERMVADAMAALHNHTKLLGMLPDIVAHHKEGGLDAIAVEHIKHPRRDLGNGAVVESEVNGTRIFTIAL